MNSEKYYIIPDTLVYLHSTGIGDVNELSRTQLSGARPGKTVAAAPLSLRRDIERQLLRTWLTFIFLYKAIEKLQ